MTSNRRSDPSALLAQAPAAVRRRMLAADRLAPGAAAVVGRFFAVAAARREPLDAPSRATFDSAAASEATLGILLRALAAHAPDVGLAAGREARKSWYARRVGAGVPRRVGPAPLPRDAPEAWPIEWALIYPRLRDAPIKESSRRRHIASVSRCAAALAATDADPDWSRYFAYSVLEALELEGLRPATIASYLDGLIGLALHAGLGADALDGLHEMRGTAKSRAGRIEKLKVGRIADLEERGGIGEIVATIGRLRDAAQSLPACSAAAERPRRTAAILAVELHAWARTGDLAAWRLGHELVREPTGDWRLAWMQEKSERERTVGFLSPEICEVLDDQLLAGRPARFAALRYDHLAGANWLTHGEAMPSKQPSLLVRDALGVPLHDLRTVIADAMRRLAPSRARGLIAALLGHADLRTTEEYRALCEGHAAAQDWRRIREKIASDPQAVFGAGR